MQRRTNRANSEDSEMQSLPVTVKHMQLRDDTILMQTNFFLFQSVWLLLVYNQDIYLKLPQTKRGFYITMSEVIWANRYVYI